MLTGLVLGTMISGKADPVVVFMLGTAVALLVNYPRLEDQKRRIDAHAKVGGHVVAVENVPKDQTNRYGILDVLSEDGRLAKAKGLVEKPDPDKAPSDGPNMLKLKELPALLSELVEIDRIAKRRANASFSLFIQLSCLRGGLTIFGVRRG